LLRLSAGNAAKLLEYQSSLLRLVPHPNSTVSESDQDNNPIIDQMSDLATETAGPIAQTRTVAADQPKTAATDQKIAGANARKKIAKAANARKKVAKQPQKRLRKPAANI
jgi:hypothetical protein